MKINKDSKLIKKQRNIWSDYQNFDVQCPRKSVIEENFIEQHCKVLSHVSFTS